MNRREMIAASTAAGVARVAGAQRPQGGGATPLREAAAQAWIYGLAPIEQARNRAGWLKDDVAVGQLVHDRALLGPRTRSVTTPNNDTLYSRAWIDLGPGPAVVSIPATGARYFSVALMDVYTNNYAVLSRRTIGGEGGVFTVVGPQAAADGARTIRSPTRWTWLLVRILVDDASDLPAVHALQDGFRVRAPSAPRPAPPAPYDAPWPDYFGSVQALMRDNPPPAADTAALRRMAPLGLGAAGGFDPGRFTAAEGAEIAAGVAEGRGRVVGVRRQGPVVAGWLYPKGDIGDFGQDYLYRAQVALGGLGTLPLADAVYPRPVGHDGMTILDSATSRRLRFPKGSLPPVNAFWSLSMYEAEPSGRFFFTENKIGRYAIGDRTPGLRYGPDGGLDIWISRDDPGGQRSSNWLPAPASLPYSLVLRAYDPKAALIDGAYRLPPLVIA